MIARHLRPVFRQYAAGKFFDLAEGHGLETARALKAEGEASDTGEQVQEAKLAHAPTPSPMAAAYRAAIASAGSMIFVSTSCVRDCPPGP